MIVEVYCTNCGPLAIEEERTLPMWGICRICKTGSLHTRPPTMSREELMAKRLKQAATTPDPPLNRLSPRERYDRDHQFRQLVMLLEHSIHDCEYTPTEIREAAMLAAVLYEEYNVRCSFVGRMEGDKIVEVQPMPRLFQPGSKSWEIFHRAWTKAVGQPGYDKKEWLRMEQAMSEAAKEIEG